MTAKVVNFIEEYATAPIVKKIDIILEYFSGFEKIIEGYEKCISIQIRNEREFNRRKDYAELGVRVQTSNMVKRRINHKLQVEGILLTMVDQRTNLAKEISLMVYDTYADSVKGFDIEIPSSVRASETSYKAKSIYEHDPKGKAAFAYTALTKEVLADGE